MEKTEHVGYTDSSGMSRIQEDFRNRRANDTQDDGTDKARLATAKSRKVRVGIVGAGFAGLRCADVLLQAGCEVTILEARDRLGGRVAQSMHLGHRVDLGPNWIHGSDDNPIMDIAKQTGTELHAWDDDALTFDEAGKLFSKEEADEYGALLWDDGLIADAFRYSNEKKDIDPQENLYDFFVEKSRELFKDKPEEEAQRKRQRLLQFTWQWSCYIGSPVTRQSLKFFWLEECIEGENPFVAGTYHNILQAVAAPAIKGANILLNTEVVEISCPQDATGKEDQTEQLNGATGSSSRPSVRTAKGEFHEFDEVVVAAPLGWLKRNKSAFLPELPSRLSSAIDNISYGQLDKVYITFPSAFWDTPPSSTPNNPPSASTAGIDPAGKTPNVTATTTPLHQPFSSSSSHQHNSFIHWLQPSYAPSTNPSQWMQEALSLSALQPPACAHPTLLFYIQGPQSTHIGSLVQNSTSPSDRDAKLIQHFEPYFSLLPNYSTSGPNCVPTAVLATAWAVDKFAGYGSYSNFQVGLEDGGRDIEVMRHGMPERRVWFAGEHTAPFVASGTTTGAYWSGEAVGKRIARAYGLEMKEE